mmetsp:Transcript_22603/g.21773  ORF Transcript_22603/g.21773 Transcript_22603/m.21773 type:complete len:89 (+) Transcript_22603:187-453(+)
MHSQFQVFELRVSDLQEQINKLGEEIALDINQLEKEIKTQKQKKWGEQNGVGPISINPNKQLSQKELIGYIDLWRKQLDDRKAGIEDV